MDEAAASPVDEAPTAAATPPTLNSWTGVALTLVGALALHLAYAGPLLSGLTLVYLWALVRVARDASRPQALVLGLLAGLAVMVPQLHFLFGIFHVFAVPLWCVLASWTALFVLLARAAFRRLPKWWAVALVPFLWTGQEYFRSELYYLRFSWINPGFAFADNLPGALVPELGVYGTGFVIAALAAVLVVVPSRMALGAGMVLPAVLLVGSQPAEDEPITSRFQVAGLQLEGLDAAHFRDRLDALLAQYPDTDLVVLNEYAFTGPIPEDIRDWCRQHRLYLVAGGTVPVAAGDTYRNTAFVIGPDGNEVFRQVKCVPIQFFRDGLPAEDQGVWESPWGRIGICICYDLSYTRVTDRLVELGAQALVVPTMDAQSWGEYQHRLHARVAPLRAREYGVPVVRVASSGISQIVDRHGRVVASAPFPGIGESIAGAVVPGAPATLPPGRPVARLSVAVMLLWLAVATLLAVRDVFQRD
ncbi:MAG: nitrilase-related carbon-nitrogen hydrolase [Planctomycetota bacterium]|jgi:apolipoprotein N-acyltransferase